MTPIKAGVYAAFDEGWLTLRPGQVEAYLDMRKKRTMTMFTMGGCEPPKYGEIVGESKSTKVKYLFKIELASDLAYMQLGDKLFHQILQVPEAPSPSSIK